MEHLDSSRIFASNYQLMITDTMSREITEEMNWNDDKSQRGYAGDCHTLLVSTEADLNDHWVDLYLTDKAPNFDKYQRVVCLYFSNETGNILVSSVIDDEPTIETELKKGDYTIYVTANNLGVDQLSLGEQEELSDEEYKERLDLERYRIFVITGKPSQQGKIRDTA